MYFSCLSTIDHRTYANTDKTWKIGTWLQYHVGVVTSPHALLPSAPSILASSPQMMCTRWVAPTSGGEACSSGGCHSMQVCW